MGELPLAAIERIMKKAGAERISMDAITSLAEILEDIGIKITIEAIELAKHAKRKTIKKEDIKLAAKRTTN
jgi:histone H3/H4